MTTPTTPTTTTTTTTTATTTATTKPAMVTVMMPLPKMRARMACDHLEEDGADQMNGARSSLRDTLPARRVLRRGDRGAVLLLMMMLIIGLLGLGVTGLWLTSGNLQVQANNNLRAQALLVAEAGVARVRAALNGGANVDSLLLGQNSGMDDVPTGLNADGKPNGAGAVFVSAGVPLWNVAFPPASFARTSGTATAPLAATMGRYSIWIRNDTAECRAGQFTHDVNGTVLVRSRGVAADNLTTVVLEVALGATPAVPGTPGAAAGLPPVLCVSGKNACDDNSSTISGVVAN